MFIISAGKITNNANDQLVGIHLAFWGRDVDQCNLTSFKPCCESLSHPVSYWDRTCNCEHHTMDNTCTSITGSHDGLDKSLHDSLIQWTAKSWIGKGSYRQLSVSVAKLASIKPSWVASWIVYAKAPLGQVNSVIIWNIHVFQMPFICQNLPILICRVWWNSHLLRFQGNGLNGKEWNQ